MKLSLKFTLLKHANLYAPAPMGIQDILICDNKVVAIAPNIDPKAFEGCTTYALDGKAVCPGLIDQHIHLIGGGGEAGPQSRTPEASLSRLTSAGVTTVVGLLGTDHITRHPESLLAKVYALNNEGITAHMLTGAYAVPSPTITGSIEKDIACIPPVIGVKVAISDHRSATPSTEELCRIASSARVGGLLGAKAGVTVFHMGNSAKAFAPIEAILENSDVPISKLLPTHVNRKAFLLEAAIDFAKKGGYIDITSGIIPVSSADEERNPGQSVRMALEQGVALSHITLSSDGQGSQPVFDATGKLVGMGVAGSDSLLVAVREMVLREGIPFEAVIQTVTSNVATFLQLDSGRIEEGKIADLLVLDSCLQMDMVFAKGRLMAQAGQACVKGTFESC